MCERIDIRSELLFVNLVSCLVELLSEGEKVYEKI